MLLCLNVNYNGFINFIMTMDCVGELLGRASFFRNIRVYFAMFLIVNILYSVEILSR